MTLLFNYRKSLKNAALCNESPVAVIIGAVMLLIGGNQGVRNDPRIYKQYMGLKHKPKNGTLKILKDRFLSFSVIISLGFLLLVSGIIEALTNQLQASFPHLTIVVFYIFNLTLTITTLIFATIFKVLPDAKIKWKDIFVGALLTACLFMIGKFGISLYISQTKVGSTYGAAGSLVLLVGVYYSSIIL